MMSDVEILLMTFLRQHRRAHVEEVTAHLAKVFSRTFTRAAVRNIIMRINAKLPDTSRIRMVEGGRGKGKAVYELVSTAVATKEKSR